MHKAIPVALLLAGCAATAPEPTPAPAPPPPAASERTEILDRAAAERLRGNSGVTLQWIGWDDRGRMAVRQDGALMRLSGGQRAPNGPGRLTVDGAVREIGRDYFVFEGRIVITDTPDIGRECVRDGRYRFAVTQNRKYWRLQEMEVCGGLTDYVDIYF